MYLEIPSSILFVSLALFSPTWARYSKAPIPPDETVEHAKLLLASDGSSACEVTCAKLALDSSIPTFFAPDESRELYAQQQGELVSACRVEPGGAADVSHILQAVKEAECHFAVRSGGHSVWTGASSTDGGITVSLSRINHVEVSDDRRTVRLGSGGLWASVYKTLEDEGLYVVGGRSATVGVGGLLLGGGMSYISKRYGFGMDTIIAFEMVLPDGSIARIDESTPELYWAMKGGGLSNFGIVTSFEVEAIEPLSKAFWFSFSSHAWDQVPAVVEETHSHLTEQETVDLDAVSLQLYIYNQEAGMPLTVIMQIHGNHTDADTVPPAFQSTTRIPTLAPSQPQMMTYYETLKMGEELGPPNGLRSQHSVTTFRPSKEAAMEIAVIVHDMFEKVKHIEGLYVNVAIQPIYRNILMLMAKRGGNSLGLEPDEGPMHLLSIAGIWERSADDDFMLSTVQSSMEAVEAVTKKHGVFHPYKYVNYAGRFQAGDVWMGFGKERLKELKRLQREYDPEQIFVEGGLNDGYFKLNRREVEAKDTPKDEL